MYKNEYNITSTKTKQGFKFNCYDMDVKTGDTVYIKNDTTKFAASILVQGGSAYVATEVKVAENIKVVTFKISTGSLLRETI